LKRYDNGKPVTVLEDLGEVKYEGRKYKVAKEQVSSGATYISIKLYNALGKFIKRLMIDEGCAPEIGYILRDPKDRTDLGPVIRAVQNRQLSKHDFLQYVGARWDEIAEENVKNRKIPEEV
jgi:hypothetical protein